MNPFETPPTPEPSDKLTIKQQRQAAHWVATTGSDPELPEIITGSPSGKSIESIEQLQAFHALCTAFEATYSLEELHGITEITLTELVGHPIRKPANQDLIPIRKAYDALKDRSDIPAARRDEMEQWYFRLSRAVGIYNSVTKTVDHDRC